MASANTHVLINLTVTAILMAVVLLVWWLAVPCNLLLKSVATPFLVLASLYIGHKYIPRLTNPFIEK